MEKKGKRSGALSFLNLMLCRDVSRKNSKRKKRKGYARMSMSCTEMVSVENIVEKQPSKLQQPEIYDGELLSLSVTQLLKQDRTAKEARRKACLATVRRSDQDGFEEGSFVMNSVQVDNGTQVDHNGGTTGYVNRQYQDSPVFKQSAPIQSASRGGKGHNFYSGLEEVDFPDIIARTGNYLQSADTSLDTSQEMLSVISELNGLLMEK